VNRSPGLIGGVRRAPEGGTLTGLNTVRATPERPVHAGRFTLLARRRVEWCVRVSLDENRVFAFRGD
jgi:hypothetical protein